MRATITPIALTFLMASTAAAQFDLSWYTIDGGGGTSSGGGFELSGTIGQADAGPASGPMTGGSFELLGGFWALPPVGELRGDMNCDGVVNFDDIDAFVLALVSQAAYESEFPGCNYTNGDINQDSAVNFDDIDGFVGCLIMSGCP